MDIALLRILLAPSLVLVVSLVARRAGPALGGRLLGAPTTTGPFLLLMCWDSGGTAAWDDAAKASYFYKDGEFFTGLDKRAIQARADY
ncbi:hypothetical protein, partial [Streptomyces zhihengii]